MKFRYDINALRAIAVMGILFFHFKIPYFQGGFAGVDIFFVISGYLMTGIITNNIKDGTFSFADFYGKRIKRIMPALLILVITITLLCFYIYFPTDYKLNERNAAASIAFISNIYYLRHSNYFDPSSSTNIFLHTWSLSVEWQFYLIYPVILLLLNKWVKKRRTIVVIFSTAICIGFLTCIIYLRSNPAAVFFLMPTRLWELLLGGLAFYLQESFPIGKYKKYIAILSYLLIFLCFIFLKENTPWPGIYAPLPTFATFLIIASNGGHFQLQNNKAIQFIGKISYSLYLWHWPVYVIAVYLGFFFTPLFIPIAVLTSLILAYLSYTFIEKLKFKQVTTLLVCATSCLALTCLFGILPVNEIIFNTKTLKIAEYREAHMKEFLKEFSEDGCFITPANEPNDLNVKSCLSLSSAQTNILLLGDSHAAHISRPLKIALQKKGINLIRAMSIGGLPIIPLNGGYRNKAVMGYIFNNYIKKNANKISGVILSGSWILMGKVNQEQLISDFDSTIRFFSNYQIPVVIIGQNENYFIPFTNIAARESRFNFNIRDHYIDKYAYTLNLLLAQKLKPYYVDIYNREQVPELSEDDVPYMFDEDHFTKYGADFTVKKILSDSVFCKFLNKRI